MHDEAPSVFPFGLPPIYGVAKALTDWSPPSDKNARGHYRDYLSNVGRTAKVGKPTAEEADT